MNEIFISINLLIVIFLSVLITEVSSYVLYQNRFSSKNIIKISFEGFINFIVNLIDGIRNKTLNYNSFAQYILSLFIIIFTLYVYLILINIIHINNDIYFVVTIGMGLLLNIYYILTRDEIIQKINLLNVLKNTFIVIIYLLIIIYTEKTEFSLSYVFCDLIFLIYSLICLSKIQPLPPQKNENAFLDNILLILIKNSLIISVITYYLNKYIQNIINDSSVIIFVLLCMVRVFEYISKKQKMQKNVKYSDDIEVSKDISLVISLAIIRLILWKL